MSDLQPYPEYKDSGLPWLGRVPAHWAVRRAKYPFGCIDVRSTTGEEELLTVSAEHGVVPRSSMKVTMFKAESYIGHKLCWPNDLVINSLWAWGRGLGVTKHHGIISSAYGVYRLRPGFEPLADFIHHLVRSAPFHWELRARSKGVWTSRLQLTDDAFLNAPIPMPPPGEAEAAARFISMMDRRIRRFIRNRRRLIEVLSEQKQAIINRAVTRGLDPNAPVIASEPHASPSKWGSLAFGRCVSSIEQGWSPVAAEGHITADQWAVLTLSCMRKGAFHPQAIKPIARSADVPLRMVVSDGDLLVSRSNTRELVGDCCIVSGVRPRTILSDLIYRINIRTSIVNPKFALYWLLSPTARQRIEVDARGSSSTMVKLSHRHIKAWTITLPDLATQMAIVQFLDAELDVILNTIERVLKEIDLIREYRTRLIADVVTGKVDVRGLAPDEPLPADEQIDEGIDDEEMLGDDEPELVEEIEE